MNALECHDSVCYAKASGLRYVSDTKPGYTRKLHGKHFQFFDTHGKQVRDEDDIARIRKLAIPPAYKEVWICPYPNGHLQATGIDARGRKQYRYHPEWRVVKDSAKFSHIIAFGEKLPEIRKKVKHHLAKHELGKEKVLATIVDLLEKTMIRVGNESYARENQSYGLTTLRPEHVDVTGSKIRFRFTGKSGKHWDLKLTDKRIANTIRKCEEIEGQELFKYLDADGNAHDITSSDVNQYLKEIAKEDFTAKDYRTWSGTVIAAIALQEYEQFDSEAQAKKNVLRAIEHVAQRLGNTPSVCRKCYIHPEIINAYLDGSLIAQITTEIDKTLKSHYGTHLTAEEIQVLHFLKNRLENPGKKRA